MVFERVRSNLSLEEIILNVRLLSKYILTQNKALSYDLKPIRVKALFETDDMKS